MIIEIPNKLFFRIGEVAELLNVKTSVLRFWETEFSFIQPDKSKSGHRVYQKKEVERLVEIRQLLYVDRFSIEGAKKKLKANKTVSKADVKEITKKITEKNSIVHQPTTPHSHSKTDSRTKQLYPMIEDFDKELDAVSSLLLESELTMLMLKIKKPLTSIFKF